MALMQAKHYFKRKILFLIEEINHLDADSLVYMLDKLARDMVQFNDFDDATILVARALDESRQQHQLSNMSTTDDANDDMSIPTINMASLGRPKFLITEEQLDFFVGKFIILMP